MKSAEIVMPATLVAYFLLLIYISRRVSRKSAGGGNDDFFRAGHSSPWWMVAVGMVGASISGVTFMSVPGWAAATGMTYLQMCLGFIPGYLLVAYVLLPVYYKLRLTSIYTVLADRLGKHSHRTGAAFFVLSKLTGAAARLFPVCLVLDTFVTRPMLRAAGFALGTTLTLCLTALALLGLMWGYTRRGGIKVLVRTDMLQTVCMLGAAVAILFAVIGTPQMGWGTVAELWRGSVMTRVFDWDRSHTTNFWRQFISGMFIVVVMTGLDQDMMQKNLTCKDLRSAQKEMCLYGTAFLPVNFLFLFLGVLLYTFCARTGIALPQSGDELLTAVVASGALGWGVCIAFAIGLSAAAFSSADSALTALTTTICIDLLRLENREGLTAAEQETIRRRVHICVVAAVVLMLLAFRLVGDATSLINAIYVIASYTYGPLLGLFAYSLFVKHTAVRDRYVPAVCIAAPLICLVLDLNSQQWFGYKFGYELLLLNGLITFGGLLALRK